MAEKVSKKTMKMIEEALRIKLDDVEEFDLLERHKLFQESPQFWTETETALADYQSRIEMGMVDRVRKILGFDSPRQGDGDTGKEGYEH